MSTSNYFNSHILPEQFLGKPTTYHDIYQPMLLRAIPRSLNRELINFDLNHIGLTGEDIWTLYEISWLNQKGLPQVSIGELVLDMRSTNLIESKSLKLYLNSFSQTRFLSLETVRQTIEHDLSNCAIGLVTVTLFQLKDVRKTTIGHLPGVCIDEQDIRINNYELNSHYLHNSTAQDIVQEQLVSHLFKSNCLITRQPDWATIQISYYGLRIHHESLLRYLISYRKHYEFHEQCAERIFHDILTYCNPNKLSVYIRYTRRGGIDINPWRSNTEYIPYRTRLVRQ
ncbi:NADPH-dependent 7-cyano-7-deazaguanine reductase QueF [Candidatus Erwinia haradaeae]|uniref:NADPH-dependent 7-cyano-7-deazaguanine reductase n=1 Tax=Candidatus Erwinia haradaeae TaxID=1922217 RepID=A0A451DME3_9GAMM|nr:NADPH-dependent 7-cyano-7-deazaguanine reductase QueF [Candidatus Erwinia haradaeae]VFP87905.1 NADPH-dependent 7-cyano-7-deazaguanine reductase [Candidatus Erwinia haradaeae]